MPAPYTLQAPYAHADQWLSFTPCPTLPSWTEAMRHAMHAHRAGWVDEAAAQYAFALAWARMGLLVLEDADQPCTINQADEVLHAWVSTLVCQSALLAETDQLERSAQNLADAHKRVLTWLKRFPMRDTRHASAVWHSRQSHAALLSHWAEHGPRPCLEDALHAGCLSLSAPVACRGLQGHVTTHLH